MLPSFETLDAIADSVTPTLGAITLLLPALPAVRARTPILRWYLLLFAALVIVYGLMFIEHQHRNWWPIGIYSTHTALATALVVLWSGAGKVIFRVGLGLLVAYALLMLYQGYHTVADVLSTAAVISALLFGIICGTRQQAIRREATA